MGNAILCRSAPCTTPRPVYKTVLQQIFQIAVEKPKTEPGSTKNSTIDNNETTASKTSPEQIDIPKLQAHVKSHIKGLIDYLEGSHNKLIDTGNYLHKVVTGSFNPDIHMLGLLVIIELLDASSKFTHDKNFLAKLHQRSGNDAEEGEKGENKMQKKASKDLENSSFIEYGQSLRSNVLQFEDNVVEILSFLLDGKKNPFRKSSYRHVLIALNLFAQNHLGTVSAEKGETILNDALEMIDGYQQWNEKETLEVQCQFMELVITMTKTSNIAFKFKQRFINHICSTLKMCYEHLENSENNLLVSKLDPEIKELKDRIIKLAFEGITALTQSVYDLNEFGIMVSPLFSFFDNIEWKTEKLQTDIFISLLDSMNQTSFEQVEIFFIDKIVEYVDHDPTSNPYKHNNDTGVKIRMFSLLGTIFERAKKTFLSFLVIDNITLSFLNNLRDHYILGEEGKQLKEAIYNCHKQFIEKIDRSSKNLSQMLSSIAAQTLSAAFKDSKDEHFISAALEFFDFTLDEISSFPGQYFVQKECMMALIRIRTIHEHSQKAYRCIEKLLTTRCAMEDGYSPKYKRMESKKTELLTCPPDLVYSILANNLSAIKDSLEHQAESSIDLLKFILHSVKINLSLILRRDNVTLMILLAFIKKIIELAVRESTRNSNKGLLFYMVSNFLRQLQTEWIIDPISSPRTLPAPIQPFITLDFMQKENDVSNQECQKILHELEGIDSKEAETYEKDFSTCLESILEHMKTLTSASTFENLNTDFEDLGSHYGGNAFISIDDGDSHRIEPSVDHNNRSHLTDGTPKPSYYQQGQKRGGNKQTSLLSIGQIRDQNSVIKTSQAIKQEGQQDESDPSSFIDKSFENALKEAKKNKAKTNNLTKILNNQI